MVILKDICLESRPYTIIDEEYSDRISNLSKVNIFVGANNTGKSRFLRSLFYLDNNSKLKFFPSYYLIKDYIDRSEEFKEYMSNYHNSLLDLNERNAKLNVYNNLKDIEFIIESETSLKDLVNLFKLNDNSNYNNINWYDEIHEKFFPNLTFDENLFKFNFYKIYIPSLRGLIPMSINSRVNEENIDIFVERTRNDCFDEYSGIETDISKYLDISGEPKNAIITGQKFYEYVRNYLLGDLKQRKIIGKYEKYLSETFFQ